ncbi:MAG: family 20 glycosylhydrolase [Dysgonamonadaceae bacterium]|jgi:hexosaminidase|nr:family 20 glycosylhydrolase [Dysgonamonadaceae bacterium]
MKGIIKLFGMITVSGVLFSCSGSLKEADYQVVPLPQEIIDVMGNSFVLDDGVKILYPQGNEEMKRNAEFLAEYVNQMTGKALKVEAGTEGSKVILLNLGLDSENKEAYQVKVDKSFVSITGASEAGVFYGIQTLRKSLPIVKNENVALPAVEINDYPRFSYRGAHLDVARHFFPLDSVKKFVDMLALHNINRLHWHISDDQGWRIEIKKYPGLTEIGSKRAETVIGHNSGQYDGKPYGGYYTQDEAKELVDYAGKRHIIVIPEIDMPGHMQAALTAYPELGCTGGPYDVWTMWGVSEDVLCAGNDKTLEFIKDVLAEIIEIFPSEYIHVGGDECPKVRWEKCPKCQARIRELGLKSDKEHTAEERLQSYIISYAEKFLNERGHRIIGWDEILEGGLAPDATVMSWRGIEGGIAAAKQKHDAIMTPTSFLYFDYYQTTDIDDEPMAIGGYVPVEKVYGFEPVSSSLTAEESKYIIGVQANLWTEYIPEYSRVEYMELPRMAALSEVQWMQPERKNYQDFLFRITRLIAVYDLVGYNHANHIFNIRASLIPNPAENVLDVTLSTIDNADIHYTVDGTEPTESAPKYTEMLKIKEGCQFKAVAIRPGGNSKVFSEGITFNKASMKPITMLKPISRQYKFEGAITLVDGLRGGKNYKTGRWIAFYRNEMEAVVDLLQPTEITKAQITTCVQKGDWVFDARSFSIEVSEDGIIYRKVAGDSYPEMKQDDSNGIYTHELTFEPTKTRYVKFIVEPENAVPEWHGGKGSPAFVFIDEISLN